MNLWIYHFTGNVLAYIPMPRAPAVKCLRLPFGRTPASSWETRELELEHGIKTFSAYPEKNLFAVLEEWFVDGWVAYLLVSLYAIYVYNR
jgi:hypothetical protein